MLNVKLLLTFFNKWKRKICLQKYDSDQHNTQAWNRPFYFGFPTCTDTTVSEVWYVLKVSY